MTVLPDLTRLPVELRATDRAVLWNLEQRDGKPTKPLYQIRYPARTCGRHESEHVGPHG